MHLASYFWNESSLAMAAGAPAVPATFLSLTTTPSGTTIDVHRRPMRRARSDVHHPEWFQDENLWQSSDSISTNVAARFLSYYDNPYFPLQFSARMRTCIVLNTCAGPLQHLQSWQRWACPCIGLSGISAGHVCGCACEAVPRRFTITTAT
ncbi:hypothetical protein DFH08DRAFT_126987 [Mycena albidolilacea]|uniref:Uncharacterized protein n=1 Tax=Mycena albidolilacea TaxID=1033008 RepID=A0AAD7ESU7_9AGAR|nr:hypothetical protein DFH08DRAFT_126987 [Mycena albidolilacea]